MAKKLKAKRPKPVTYALIPKDSDVGAPMYERLYAIVDEHHEELSRADVRIALAWCTSWKPDVDGRVTLGKCKKASDLDRELAPFDFVILLSQEFWLNPRVSDLQRQALLDHEVCHAGIAYDENGDPKVDARGRTVFRMKKHTIEEFTEVVDRYGCYKNDLEEFARALRRAQAGTAGWVGYTALHDTLKDIGLDVPTAIIASWDDAARRDVMTWALLRREAGVRTVDLSLATSTPACLAAALQPEAPRADDATTH